MEKNTRLFIIRHGEAMGALTNRVAGMVGDEGLTPFGKEQAARLRDRLKATGEIKADVLFASTFPRARQTAEIIAPALGLPINFDDELQEMRPGEADGLSQAEFIAKYGEVNFLDYPFKPISPGGEGWPQFVLRVSQTLERVIQEYAGKTIVIVAHGGIVDSSFVYFFGMSSMSLPVPGLYTHNTSITEWGTDSRSRKTTIWRLYRYNDDAHLRPGIEWSKVAPPEEGAEQPAVPLLLEPQED